MKERQYIKIFILAVMLCGFFLSSCADEPAQTAVIIPGNAPDFTLEDLSGTSVSLSDFLGKGSIFIIFTTTWCPHCITVIPDLKQVYHDFKDKGLQVLAVYIKERDSKLSAFKVKHSIPYRILSDTDAAIAALYDIKGVPTFILLDKNGHIRYRGYNIPRDMIEKAAG
jgi:peroxiredoxin